MPGLSPSAQRHQGNGDPDKHGCAELYAGDEGLEQHQRQPDANVPTLDTEWTSTGGTYSANDNLSPENDFWVTFAGVAGNVLEWYDFAVFGYFSDVIGDTFFPSDQPGDEALIESFAVFGGAFLARPVGGVVLGYVGDVYGRKTALIVSIILMAFPTCFLGCLPSYAAVGRISYILLIIVRLMQGFSVGGQLMSSLVFTLESHPHERWGFYGSMVMAAANFGTLLGGIVAFVLRSSLTDEQLHSWGWRIPFLAGVLVSLCGFYLRKYGGDEESSASRGEEQPVNPLKAAFRRDNLRALLAASMVPILWSSGFYLSFVWMTIYMTALIDQPVPGSFAINSLALFVSVCLLFPIAGILSDRFGRRKIMSMGGLAMGLLSPFLVMAIGSGNPVEALCAQILMGVSLSFWGAPMCSWLVESFEPAARLTSVAIGYNLAQAVVGGATPALATVMVDSFGPNSPGWLLTVLATISMVGLGVVAPPQPTIPPRSSHSPSDIQLQVQPNQQVQQPTSKIAGRFRRRPAKFYAVPQSVLGDHDDHDSDEDNDLI